jgi:hypothetical protein
MPSVQRPRAQNQASGNRPCALPAGRTVARVGTHVSTFLDADARGAGRVDYVIPTAEDGQLSILTCRPTTGLSGGLRHDRRDYAARADAPDAPGPDDKAEVAPV